MVQRFQLDNGLVGIIHSRNYEQAYVILCTKAGHMHDTHGKAGLSHLVEHLSSYNSRHDLEQIEDHGGPIDANTYPDHQTYECVIDNKFLPRLLRILKEDAFTMEYSPEKLRREQKRLLSESRYTIDYPVERAAEMLQKALFGTTSSEDELASVPLLTCEDVMRFKQKYFVPNNMVLVIVGKFDSRQLRKQVCNLFGDVDSRFVENRIARNAVSSSRTEGFYGEQGYIISGKKCIGPENREYAALELSVSILCNELWTSRLRRELLVHRGLAYGVDAEIKMIRRDASLFSWSNDGFAVKDTDEVQAIVDSQIHDLAEHLVPDWELKRCRKLLLTDTKDDFDTAKGYAEALLNTEVLGLPAPNNYLKAIKNVSAEDVRDAARQNFLGRYTTVLLLPRKHAIENIAQPTSHQLPAV